MQRASDLCDLDNVRVRPLEGHPQVDCYVRLAVVYFFHVVHDKAQADDTRTFLTLGAAAAAVVIVGGIVGTGGRLERRHGVQ